MSSVPPWAGSTEPEYVTRIRVLFTQLLPSRVRTITESIERLVEGGAGESYHSSRLLFLEAHRLAGSAGAFGGDRIGEIAGQIDERLRPYYDREKAPPPEVVHALPGLLDELRAAEKEFLRWMEGEDMSTRWSEEDEVLDAIRHDGEES